MILLSENFVFSQSSLQSYQNCPYQFYLRYIARLQWPAPPAEDQIAYEMDRQAGSRFHQLIQQHFIGLASELLINIASRDPDPRMRAWYEAFLRTIAASISGELFPEHTLQVRLGEHRLMAKYDLLALDQNAYTIYDWKTSHTPPQPNRLASRMQSRVFPLVLATQQEDSSAAQAQPIRMLYWEANAPETPFVLTYSVEKQVADAIFVSDLMCRIRQSTPNDFPKTDQLRYCQYCQYRSHCQRGIKAGVHTDISAELSPETDSNPADLFSI